VLERETSTVPDLFYAVQALTNVGQKKGEAAKLIKTLQGALKKDDSLLKQVLYCNCWLFCWVFGNLFSFQVSQDNATYNTASSIISSVHCT
jgi:hypothetical protein